MDVESAGPRPGGTPRDGPAVDRCDVCGTEGRFERFQLREMLLGLRETFEYHRCPSCGVMRIGSVPDDLGRHGQPSRASVRFLLRLPGIAAARSGLRPTIRRDGHSGSCRGEEEADTSRR
ncbi:MAG TPA: hypothetical protein VIK32_15055, partial [Candidatus Limnocylindrales bacterium]